MTGNSGTSLTVQWLGLCITIAGHAGSVPHQGSRFLHAAEWQNKNNNLETHQKHNSGKFRDIKE